MSTCGLVSRVHRTPTRWLAPSPHQQNKQTQARRKRREGDHKWFIPQQRPKIETSVSTFVSHTHCPVVGIQPATRARRKNCHTPPLTLSVEQVTRVRLTKPSPSRDSLSHSHTQASTDDSSISIRCIGICEM